MLCADVQECISSNGAAIARARTREIVVLLRDFYYETEKCVPMTAERTQRADTVTAEKTQTHTHACMHSSSCTST